MKKEKFLPLIISLLVMGSVKKSECTVSWRDVATPSLAGYVGTAAVAAGMLDGALAYVAAKNPTSSLAMVVLGDYRNDYVGTERIEGLKRACRTVVMAAFVLAGWHWAESYNSNYQPMNLCMRKAIEKGAYHGLGLTVQGIFLTGVFMDYLWGDGIWESKDD